jgi:hypothetical protein
MSNRREKRRIINRLRERRRAAEEDMASGGGSKSGVAIAGRKPQRAAAVKDPFVVFGDDLSRLSAIWHTDFLRREPEALIDI